MTKSVFARVLMIIASVIIIVGVSLMCWMMATSDERNVISVRLEEGSNDTLEFERLALVPGASCEYVIKLKGDNSKKFDLNLDFCETEEHTLKNFAYVKIISGDQIVCDELMATAFDNDDIILPVDFKEGKNTELTIVYYLPIDVGNEAKNATAKFELRLKASNE